MAEILYYPEGLAQPDLFPNNIQFTFFRRESAFKSGPAEESIFLYMPEEFGQPNTVSWDTYSRLNAAMDLASMVPNSMLKSMMPNKFMRKAFQIAMAAKGSQILHNVYADANSQIVNPYLAQVFKGVDFRNFAFTFRLVPFSEKDCETIHKIIKTFRKAALPKGEAIGLMGPEKQANSKGSAYSPILEYPKEVEIIYNNNGKNNKFLHKFKRSVITKIDIKYTGAGMMSMMRNGFPAETILSLELAEMQIVLRDDIEEDGAEGGF